MSQRRYEAEDQEFSLGWAEVVEATEKAIKVELVDPVKTEDSLELTEPWIPRSVIHANSELCGIEMEGDLIVERWWAEKQGWKE